MELHRRAEERVRRIRREISRHAVMIGEIARYHKQSGAGSVTIVPVAVEKVPFSQNTQKLGGRKMSRRLEKIVCGAS